MDSEIKCLYPRRVNAELIPFLPLTSFKGDTELVETDAALDSALAEISKETLLGFDTETRPNFNKGKQYPVSILQLAGERKVWIIRLDPLAERLQEIFKILEAPNIKKVGLAVRGDIKSLRARCQFVPAGFFDISSATQNIGVINTGMRNLAALILGERISKSAQLTNWAAEELTKKQIDYAATDAWIGRRLFLEVKKIVEENRTEIEPEPEPEPKRFNLRSFVRGIIDKISSTLKGVKKKASIQKTGRRKARADGKKNIRSRKPGIAADRRAKGTKSKRHSTHSKRADSGRNGRNSKS